MEPKDKNVGVYFAAVTGGIGLAISLVSVPFLIPVFRKVCLPYVPATTNQVKNILLALKGESGTLLDIGSGDGRIVIAGAKAGFRADGVELNPWLVTYSKLSALNQGVYSKTSFYRKNLWTFNLQKYDNIVVFAVEEMMEELAKKFKDELKPDCSIVSCRFPLSNYKSISVVGEGWDKVWMYKTPLEKET